MQEPGFPGGLVEAMSKRNSHRLPAIWVNVRPEEAAGTRESAG